VSRAVSRAVAVPRRYDLQGTLAPFRLGRGDRTVRFDADGVVWRATRTPDGPGTACYRPRRGGEVHVDAWGDGAGWLLHHAPELLGCDDAVDGFDAVAARHPVVHRVARERPGIRMARSHAVYEALLPAVLSQKVTGLEARRAWRELVARWGERAPGPVRALRVPPAPEVLAALPYHALHDLGVERRRAETLRAVARHARRLDEAASLPLADARRRILAVRGVGEWTAAEVARMALGDADAVSVGDYHLPHVVCFALAGERVGDDARMLDLLAPFAPHRGRVCRLLETAGLGPPRRGPRLAPTPWMRPRWA
jgi:3-methyladenine DNA glycosylase/8-oxoguanine DNA glycosylase